MERLLLARHAETDWNVRGLLNGDPRREVSLSSRGLRQAQRLGGRLAAEPIGLGVATSFSRCRETLDIALEGRPVPRLPLASFDEPAFGSFEGRPLEEYRAWASTNTPTARPPGEGEARVATVRRYVAGFEQLLARPETIVLAVVHSLPIAYALSTRRGQPPPPRLPQTVHAHPYELLRSDLETAIETLSAWLLRVRRAT